jgi:hypothetical protein
VHETPRKWKTWLPLPEFWHNCSFHSSLGSTPFKVIYGYDASVVSTPILCSPENKSLQDMLTERQIHIGLIRKHLAAAQNRIKLQADKHMTDRHFQVGDQVLLKLQTYVQSSMVNRLCPKVVYKFYEPYTVQEHVGLAAYRLDIPVNSVVHPVFHISQLKEFIPDYKLVFSELPVQVDFSKEMLQLESVLERRLVKKGNAVIPHVRVKWERLPKSAAT